MNQDSDQPMKNHASSYKIALGLALIVGGWWAYFSASRVSGLAVSGGSVVVVLVYGFFVSWKIRSAQDVLREEWVDSIYYLGFLFTLMSICFSLSFFGARSTGGLGLYFIVRQNGMALTTTIVGLILRLMLSSDGSKVGQGDYLEPIGYADMWHIMQGIRRNAGDLEAALHAAAKAGEQGLGDAFVVLARRISESKAIQDLESAIEHAAGRAGAQMGVLEDSLTHLHEVMERVHDAMKIAMQGGERLGAALSHDECEQLGKSVRSLRLEIEDAQQRVRDVKPSAYISPEQRSGRWRFPRWL